MKSKMRVEILCEIIKPPKILALFLCVVNPSNVVFIMTGFQGYIQIISVRYSSLAETRVYEKIKHKTC